MNITFTKLDRQRHALELRRADGSIERTVLESAVFFLHDLTHYVVERLLKYERGFWGMLAAGHALADLSGKANPLTNELRFIEKIVGPVQSAYMGHFPPNFVPTAIAHLDYSLPDRFAELALERLRALEREWTALPFGGQLKLEW